VVVLPDADRLADEYESIIPSLTYRQLVDNLPQLAELGVLAEGSLPLMLVVVRLVDRRRILQSGFTSIALQNRLREYRKRRGWELAAWGIEDALEQAIRVLRLAENPLEDKAQAAAYATR